MAGAWTGHKDNKDVEGNRQVAILLPNEQLIQPDHPALENYLDIPFPHSLLAAQPFSPHPPAIINYEEK